MSFSTESSSHITGRPPFPTRTSTNYIEASTAATLSALRSNEAGGGLPAQTLPLINRGEAENSSSVPKRTADDDLAAQNEAAERELLAEQDSAKRSSVDMRSTGIKSPTELAKVKSEDREAVGFVDIGEHSDSAAKSGTASSQEGSSNAKRFSLQTSWDQRDLRRVMQESLMTGDKKSDHGYSGEAQGEGA